MKPRRTIDQFTARWEPMTGIPLADLQRWPEDEYARLSTSDAKRLNCYVGAYVYGALLYCACPVQDLSALLGFGSHKLLTKLSMFIGYAHKSRTSSPTSYPDFLALLKEAGTLFDKLNELCGVGPAVSSARTAPGAAAEDDDGWG